MSVPSKRLCTRVACEVGWVLLPLPLPLPLPPSLLLPLFVVALGAVEGAAEDASEPTLVDTMERGESTCQRDREHRPGIRLRMRGHLQRVLLQLERLLGGLTVVWGVLGRSRRGAFGSFAVFLLEFLYDFI